MVLAIIGKIVLSCALLGMSVKAESAVSEILPRDALPHYRDGARAPFPPPSNDDVYVVRVSHVHEQLEQIRAETVLKRTRTLVNDTETWYKVGNVFETIGRAARYLAPLLTGLAAALNSQKLGFVAMGIGLSGAASTEFSTWCHEESKERGRLGNEILMRASLEPLPLLRSYEETPLSSTRGAPPGAEADVASDNHPEVHLGGAGSLGDLPT